MAWISREKWKRFSDRYGVGIAVLALFTAAACYGTWEVGQRKGADRESATDRTLLHARYLELNTRLDRIEARATERGPRGTRIELYQQQILANQKKLLAAMARLEREHGQLHRREARP